MQSFAALYTALDETRATRVKVEAMKRYFAQASPADAAWAVFFLSGQRLKRTLPASRLRAWIAAQLQLSPALIDESYAQVGDLAETLALLLDTAGVLPPRGQDLGLAEWVGRLQSLPVEEESEQRARVWDWWRELPRPECFLFNKLVTGELRVGVSAGLVARALAEHIQLPVEVIQHRLMGGWQPDAAGWAALNAASDTPAQRVAQPYPFCLAAPLELEPNDTAAAAGGAGDAACLRSAGMAGRGLAGAPAP